MDDQTTDHLRISSPSNTAVKYTISSRTREPAKFVVILRHALRIIVAFYTTLATIAKLQLTFAFEIDQTVEQLLDITLMSGFVRLVMDNAQWDYTEESLLVLQGLGVQTSTSSSYFFLSPTTTFIPTTQIQDIVIHEAFKGFEVRFFLAIIVTGATEVVVVFPVVASAG
ncbi:hypothetical protein OHC33_004676 [Knufia fluminis]|uniref:Phosphatidylinositol N-acetylglucosaminyltransferase subunit H conserved domain-containing protein n=1 Tax=Knufia fluminis TaxID=191047 RepID=A0AAN8EF02_9EURO|nr:hypothetical protein OHC33_004676 [Knufia fluminis]